MRLKGLGKKMKVLVILATDSDNLMMENILRELKRRGHSLRIFSRYMDRKFVRMLDGLTDGIFPTEQLADEDIEWCDCIFRGHPLLLEFSGDKIIFAKKYTYIFSPYLENHWHTAGREFIFSIGISRVPGHKEDSASMAIGNPKNDTPSAPTAVQGEKRFLFVDSGHFPFSHSGKVQVAQLLLSICKKFPDYKLVIKPRFLPTDDVVTNNHSNYDHIYTLITELSGGKVPENLVMPMGEHLDMQQQIDKSSCVLVLCSSAYIDVALRGKRLIIIEGLDNDDKIELRNGIEYKNIYDLRRKSGCVVNYKDVLDYLPEGLACNESHLKEVVAYPQGASPRAVDVMEYIYENFLQQGLFPTIRNYDYETFRTDMKPDNSLSWNELLRKRLKNIGNERMNFFNTIVADIDVSKYVNFIDSEYRNFEPTEEGLAAFHEALTDLQNSIVLENRDRLMDDALNQSVYLRKLFNTQRWCELSSFTEEQVLCKSEWHFLLGILSSIDGVDMKGFAYHYMLFLKEAFSRSYAKYECEQPYGIRTAAVGVMHAYNTDESFVSLEDLAFVFASIGERGLLDCLSDDERNMFFGIMVSHRKEIQSILSPSLSSRVFSIIIQERCLHDDTRMVALECDKAINECARLRQSRAYRLGHMCLFVPRKAKAFLHRLRNFQSSLLCRQGVFRKMRSAYKKMKKAFLVYSKVIKEFGADAYFHLTAGGTGDVYIACQFYDQYVKHLWQDENAVMVCPGRSCAQTAKLFDIERVFEAERTDWTLLLCLLRFMGYGFAKLDILYYHIFTVYTGFVTWLEGFKGWNLFNLMQTIHFDGISDESRAAARFSFDDREMKMLFSRNNLPEKKTVILCPYARWAKPVQGGFWENLAEALKDRGYAVCTNSMGDSEPAIAGTVPVSYSYRVSVPVIERAGFFVGLRSGFCDIVESAHAKKVALYPYNCPKRGIANGTALGSFSLNAMFGRNDWLELETNPVNLAATVQRIILYFES